MNAMAQNWWNDLTKEERLALIPKGEASCESILKAYEKRFDAKPTSLDKVEIEGVYECPCCGGHFMVDSSYLSQVDDKVTCMYCKSEIKVPEDDGDDAFSHFAKFNIFQNEALDIILTLAEEKHFDALMDTLTDVACDCDNDADAIEKVMAWKYYDDCNYSSLVRSHLAVWGKFRFNNKDYYDEEEIRKAVIEPVIKNLVG